MTDMAVTRPSSVLFLTLPQHCSSLWPGETQKLSLVVKSIKANYLIREIRLANRESVYMAWRGKSFKMKRLTVTMTKTPTCQDCPT